jgi:hypothetical protein
MHVIYYCVDQKIPPVLSKTMQEINIYIYIINGHVCVALELITTAYGAGNPVPGLGQAQQFHCLFDLVHKFIDNNNLN